MNFAKLENSPRLQRALDALLRAGKNGLTTFDLFVATGSMAVHSDVSEIRANGYDISCAMVGKNASGRRVYRYTLEGKRAVA